MTLFSKDKKLTGSLELGAAVHDDGVHFRLWAPKLKEVSLVIEAPQAQTVLLSRESDGYFSCFIPHLKPGAIYQYLVDGKKYPDPCSRYLPTGPHGASMVIDPSSFEWSDDEWQKNGVNLKGQIIYEVHVGAFSPSGTYSGIIDQLSELKQLGITAIELLPIAEFPGRWNWGYDGVSLFSPAHVYGTPDELRTLVDRAHAEGIAVILDVVYNHLGPDGNYLKIFSDDYFTSAHVNDWGEAINFYIGEASSEVRKYFISNACYWLDEFHFDGLRLDATQNIYDHGPSHIIGEITKAARKAVAPKKIILIGENESQDTQLIRPVKENGFGMDGLWNDDFHHSAIVALGGRREAYFTDYHGKPQEFLSSFKYGYLYQGQFYKWQDQNRGTFFNATLPSESLIVYLENHDQVANSLTGERVQKFSDPSSFRALTALFLLSPQTPMLFMGQEFGASSPFNFFVDHNKDLAPQVYEGRKQFLAQFPSFAVSLDKVIDPNREEAFYQSKLKFEERQINAAIYQMHKDLLKLRREDPVISRQDRRSLDGAVLTEQAWCVRYFDATHGDRLLIVNLGNDAEFIPCPEPLLANSPQCQWELIWSSEHPQYGGYGISHAFSRGKGVFLQARCAQLFLASIKTVK